MATTPADRLRRARADAGYESAEAAASARNWLSAGYRHHENGTRPFFNIDNALRYARAFRVSPQWLLGLDEECAGVVDHFNAEALGQVVQALLQAYAPDRRLPQRELQGLGEALKETLQEMLDNPAIANNADHAVVVAGAVARARRRAGK